jgi:hypothetical protein
MAEKNKFILFSNCIPVKGFRQSTICDLQLGRVILIPNYLYSFLLRSRDVSYDIDFTEQSLQ